MCKRPGFCCVFFFFTGLGYSCFQAQKCYYLHMTINWTTIHKKYRGNWVALREDEKTVVGSGKTLKAAVEQAKKKGYEHPIVTRLPKEITAYVGYEISL